MFEPPQPVPIQPKVLDERPVDQQMQSPLLGMLPAEIRNEIYGWVFRYMGVEEMDEADEEDEEDEGKETEPTGHSEDGDPDEAKEETTPTAKTPNSPPTKPKPKQKQKQKPTQPLSLLLSCRKIRFEATLLAFSTRTFITRSTSPQTFHALRARTSILSSAQLSAITSLAYDLSEAETYYFHRGTPFIANSLILFSGLKNLELRIKKGKPVERNAVHAQTPWPAYEGGLKERRVPSWLLTTVQNVVKGREYAWQKGEKWSVLWPQERTACFLEEMLGQGRPEMAREAVAEAMQGIDGVEPCACACGEPSWMMCEMLQETGRRVRLQVLYYGSVDLDRFRELQRHRVRLEPGAEPLPLTMLPNANALGFGWDGEAEYWEGFRRSTEGFTGLLERLGWVGKRDGRGKGLPVVLEPGGNGWPVSRREGEDAFAWDVDERYWMELRARNGDLGAIWGVLWRSA